MRRLVTLVALVVLAGCGSDDPATGKFVTPSPEMATVYGCAHAQLNRVIAGSTLAEEPPACMGLSPAERQQASDLLRIASLDTY